MLRCRDGAHPDDDCQCLCSPPELLPDAGVWNLVVKRDVFNKVAGAVRLQEHLEAHAELEKFRRAASSPVLMLECPAQPARLLHPSGNLLEHAAQQANCTSTPPHSDGSRTTCHCLGLQFAGVVELQPGSQSQVQLLYHLSGPGCVSWPAQHLLGACRLADQAADVGRSTEVAALQNASSLAGESLLAIVTDSVAAGYTSQEVALNASYASNSTSQVCTMYITASVAACANSWTCCGHSAQHNRRPEQAMPAAARLDGSRDVLVQCNKQDTACMPSMPVL